MSTAVIPDGCLSGLIIAQAENPLAKSPFVIPFAAAEGIALGFSETRFFVMSFKPIMAEFAGSKNPKVNNIAHNIPQDLFILTPPV
jgi:hypothetical protein